MSSIQTERSETPEFDENPDVFTEHGLFGDRKVYTVLSIKLFFFFLGILVTFLVYFLFFEEFAFTELLRGFSFETFQNSLIPFDLSNFLLTNIIWFYYIGMIILLVLFPRMFQDLNVEKNKKEYIYLEKSLSSFREGALYIPLITTIAFSILFQIILPSLIVIVVFLEILFPIIILSELAFLSKKYLIKFYREIKVNSSIVNMKFLLISLALFPLGVFIFVETDLTKFLTLIDYNLLWENPNSQIALRLWEIINDFISFISFNNNLLFNFFSSIKHFVVTILVLSVVATIYYYSKKFLKLALNKFSENLIYKY